MRDERGDIVSGWLIRLALFMAVIGFIGYEGLSMAATAISLDGHAERVADAAADVLQDSRGDNEEGAEEAAYAEAEERDVEITSYAVEDDVVVVTVTRMAPTIIAQSIPGLKTWTEPSATRQSKWRP